MTSPLIEVVVLVAAVLQLVVAIIAYWWPKNPK